MKNWHYLSTIIASLVFGSVQSQSADLSVRVGVAQGFEAVFHRPVWRRILIDGGDGFLVGDGWSLNVSEGTSVITAGDALGAAFEISATASPSGFSDALTLEITDGLRPATLVSAAVKETLDGIDLSLGTKYLGRCGLVCRARRRWVEATGWLWRLCCLRSQRSSGDGGYERSDSLDCL